jgi:hypothetical protein
MTYSCLYMIEDWIDAYLSYMIEDWIDACIPIYI